MLKRITGILEAAGDLSEVIGRVHRGLISEDRIKSQGCLGMGNAASWAFIKRSIKGKEHKEDGCGTRKVSVPLLPHPVPNLVSSSSFSKAESFRDLRTAV